MMRPILAMQQGTLMSEPFPSASRIEPRRRSPISSIPASCRLSSLERIRCALQLINSSRFTASFALARADCRRGPTANRRIPGQGEHVMVTTSANDPSRIKDRVATGDVASRTGGEKQDCDADSYARSRWHAGRRASPPNPKGVAGRLVIFSAPKLECYSYANLMTADRRNRRDLPLTSPPPRGSVSTATSSNSRRTHASTTCVIKRIAS